MPAALTEFRSPASPPPAGRLPRVVIIGGGLAGIAAAVALADAGCAVTLIEARRSLGGRAGSYEDPQTGQTLDNCQHVLLGCCTNLLDLYRRIGADRHVRFDRAITFLDPAGRPFRLSGTPGLPAPLHFGVSLLRFSLLTIPERLALSRAMLAMMRLDAAARLRLLDVPFGCWLDAHAQPPSLVRKLYDPVLVSALNEDTRRVSAAYAIQVFQGSLLSNAAGYVMGVPERPLGALYDGLTVPAEDDTESRGEEDKGTRGQGDEGASGAGDGEAGANPTDSNASAARIPPTSLGRSGGRNDRSGAPDAATPPDRETDPGLRSAALRSEPGLPGRSVSTNSSPRPRARPIDVRLGARVARLLFSAAPARATDAPTPGPPVTSSPDHPVPSAPHVTGVELLDGTVLHADVVILATNHHAARRLVPADLAARDGRLPMTEALEDVPILGVHLTFDRPVMPEHPHVALTAGPLQWLFRKDPAGRTLHGVISAARPFASRPHAELLPLLESQIRTLLPKARHAKLEHGTVVIEKRATFSPLPGSDRHRPTQAPPPGGIENLFLAGDYTQTGWPATMEGAVRSGYLAADAVLARVRTPGGGSRGSYVVEHLAVQWPSRLLAEFT